MPGALREAYDRRIAAGEIIADDGQATGLAALERLEADLTSPRPGRLFAKPPAPRGVYLWGPVGRGKSMLMDLFFAAAPVERKRRLHFHVFMARVHALANVWRSGDEAARGERFGRIRPRGGSDDPVGPIAELTARECRLLCFDELEVTDIADAMILGRLFEALFERDVVLVATSNRPPRDLYKDGINRQLFLPFIALIEGRLEVVAVDGPADHRLGRLRAAGAWFSPLGRSAIEGFDRLWRSMLGEGNETGVTLDVLGREQHWPRAAGGLLRANFNSLCVQSLGPADYLAIAARFHTVFLEALPRLAPEQRDAARRLAILVDTLYEAHARLVVLAEGEPREIYPAGVQAFEFQRTASRLEEMRAPDWLVGPEPRRAG